MGVDHPGLPITWARIAREIKRVAKATLQNASIGRAGIRVYEGGRILFEGGGGIQILDDGFVMIKGDLTGEGDFGWTGPWKFNSPAGGEIDGPVGLKGDFTLTGKLTSENVRIEDGKIYVGTGSNLIVIDGATGKVTVGDLVLDPSNHDGMITMPNDGQVLGSGSNLEMYGPNGSGGRNGIRILPDRVSVAKFPTANSLDGLFWVAANAAGDLFKVSQATGGPMGSLVWPFPASSVTSEYGPRDGGFHEGIDFGQPEGAPIPAAAAGTVVEAVTLHAGWGNYVKIDHGGGIATLYAHMVNPPPVSVGQHVGRGQIIGHVGNTGASQGNHLHFEVYVNGATVNPRSKLPSG